MARGRRGDPRRLGLRPEVWPDEDRAAWARACASGDLLDGSGPAAGWSAPVRTRRLVAYGRWLGFLARTCRLDPASGPAGRVTREDLRAYLDALAAECAPVTRWSHLDGLAAMLGVLAPGEDWAWLRRVAGRLRARMRPSVDRRSRLVAPGTLYAAGLAMMREALAEGPPAASSSGARAVAPGANRTLAREALYRDGLLLAVLAACPLRRRSLALLETGRHLTRDAGGAYRLALGPRETKGGRAYAAPLPADLAPWLDRYLAEVRPRLLRGGRPGAPPTARLWVSRDGLPLGADTLARRLAAAVRARLGVAGWGVHLARHGAATALAEAAPGEVAGVAALLGHARASTGERHYDLARGVLAAGAHQDRLRALRRRLRVELGGPGKGGG